MIRESLEFTYDGIASQNRGLYNIAVASGLLDEPITGRRTIQEDRDISGKRYLKKVDNEPLEFPVSFYFKDKYDDDKIRETVRWLLQDSYKPLIFSGNPNRVFYAVFIGDTRLVHNGLKEGYLTLTVRCDSNHAYSKVIASELHDLSNNSSEGTLIDFKNSGDMDVQPVIYIEKIGSGDVRFVNTSDGGKSMEIKNLLDGENIKIDCNNQIIETNSGFNRYNDFDFNWLNLIYGVNRMRVYGACKLYYKIQFKLY